MLYKNPEEQLFENHQVVRITGLSGNRLRNFQRERWIQVRGHLKSGLTASNLSAPSDIAAFSAMSGLFDALGAKRDVLGAAATGLYVWQPEQVARAFHPITHALYGTANDEWWIWQIYSLRNDQTSQRRVRSFCYNMDETLKLFTDLASPWLPITRTTINLSPLLKPIVARIRERGNATRRLDALEGSQA